MIRDLRSAYRALTRTFLLLLAAGGVLAYGACAAHASNALVKAFVLKSLPTTYEGQQRFLDSLKDTGANTVIVKVPLRADGLPDPYAVHNLIYLAHRSGLRIFFELPTRTLPEALSLHPDWEDQGYQADSGISRNGKIDLFNEDAVRHVVSIAADLSGYFIDGMVLGEDFSYGMFEGAGKRALQFAESKMGSPVEPKKIYRTEVAGNGSGQPKKAGAGIRAWQMLKRDRLQDVGDRIRTAARSAGRPLVVGVAMPVILPLADPEEQLLKYAFDADGFKKLQIDLFWAVLAGRDGGSNGGSSYQQSMKSLSRAVFSAVTAIRDDSRTLIVMHVEAADGRPAALSELEESTGLIKHAGNTGFGYLVGPETPIVPEFLKKMFRRANGGTSK